VTLATLLAATAAFTAVAMLGLWLLSLRLRDASIVDIWWGFGFAAIAWLAFGLGAGWPPRALLAACLVSLWGLRLAGHLARRNLGHGEDPRYAAMRARHGERFGRVSLFTVFGLQGLLQWIVSLPVQLAIQAPEPAGWAAWDGLGALLVLAGVACEATADRQLARFKADPTSRGQVMDRGLWRYSRHPNYFGDALAWWGLGLLALAVPGGVFSLICPALMTFLLLRVSGVPILERGLARRRPGYAEYAARTPAFVPWFPRHPR
jgi:steroid 5-alpha reductase family enzyme